MQNVPAAPEMRSAQPFLEDLRMQAARVQMAVASALVLSTCTLLYAVINGWAVLVRTADLLA